MNHPMSLLLKKTKACQPGISPVIIPIKNKYRQFYKVYIHLSSISYVKDRLHLLQFYKNGLNGYGQCPHPPPFFFSRDNPFISPTDSLTPRIMNKVTHAILKNYRG